MADLPAESSPQPQPLGYAGANTDRRRPRITPLAIVSICIACLSLAWNGNGEIQAVRRIQTAIQGPVMMQAQQKAQQAMATRLQQQAIAIQAASASVEFRALTDSEFANVVSFI